MSGKLALSLTIISVLTLIFSMFLPQQGCAETPPRIVERTIKIEGALEKPRVIFIVSRANLWKDFTIKKTYITDILRPVYPDDLIREIESTDR